MSKFIYVVLLTVSLMLAACGGTAPAPTSAGTTEKMTEYVGEIPESDFFVAIAIGSGGNVLAYVCDGMGMDYLFRGETKENTLQLTSVEGGASLQASIEGVVIAGSFSADGKSHSFTAAPAQDYGGLYKVTGLSEFEAEGISQGGATLKLSLSPDKEILHGIVTRPDGTILTYDHSWTDNYDHRAPTEYLEHWIILLNDGSGRGGKIKGSLQPGLKSLDPICIP